MDRHRHRLTQVSRILLVALVMVVLVACASQRIADRQVRVTETTGAASTPTQEADSAPIEPSTSTPTTSTPAPSSPASPEPTRAPAATNTPVAPDPSPTAATMPSSTTAGTITPVITASMPKQPDPNFAFRFEFGYCVFDVLDTFQHTFTKDLGEGEYVTIALTLTDDQMRQIYHKMRAIHFFDYPAVGNWAEQAPSGSYRFVVQNGTVTKTMEGTLIPGRFYATNSEAEQVRQLILLVTDILQQHPEVAQLPMPNVGCA